MDSSRRALQTNYTSPPYVTEEVYCFPRRQLIFSFARRVILSFEISLRVRSEIDSVCTTIFKQISGFSFYPKCLMLYINGFVSVSSTKKWKAFFFKFRIRFRNFANNRKIFRNFGQKPINIQKNREA